MAVGSDKALNTPTVLVTGATGQIGVFAIPRLLRAGFRVLAVSRNGKPGHFPVMAQVDWLTHTDALQAGKTCEYLLSAGPMELALSILTTCKKFRSAVIFSSSSVISKQNSTNPAEKKQIQDMLSLESQLESLAVSRSLKLVILRPTMIYGCGLDSNVSRLAGWIRRFGVLPVNGNANGMRQPVHADDLASAAVTALMCQNRLPKNLVLAGGSTLSYAEMVARIFSALDRPARLLRLPQWLFILLVNLWVVYKPGTGINSEMVRRQCADLVFDDRQARELLGYRPRPFEPAEKDFVPPEFE